MSKLGIISGTGNPELVKLICGNLKIEPIKAKIGKFSDGEIQVEIEESVRGMDIFLVQPICHPVNDNLVELLIMIDALKRASAEKINVVIPYFGYGRQDRKVSPRAPISAKLVASLIERAGASSMLSMDLHAGQIQGFFDGPVDHLFAQPIQYAYFRPLIGRKKVVIVSPDAGGVERARAFAKRFKNGSVAFFDKRREGPNRSQIMNLVGDVGGRIAIILDDMIDTAGSTVQVAEEIFGKATKVYAACTHAVLSGNAVDKLNNSSICELVTMNTIPLGKKLGMLKRVKVLDASPMLGDAIRRIHEIESVSAMF